jgi:hypothetical protein
VFTVKYKSNEIVDKYKTRLVAKGYTRLTIERLLLIRPRWKLVRVILSLVVNLDWSLQQLDVKKAFLYDDMVKEMYMDPFLRFMTGGKSSYRGLSSIDWATQWINMVIKVFMMIWWKRYQRLVGKLIYLAHTKPNTCS